MKRLAACFLLLGGATATASAVADEVGPIVHLSTSTGVTVEFPIFGNANSFHYDSVGLNERVCLEYDSFCLEEGKNIYIAIPVLALKEVHLVDHKDVVTLTNGITLSGRLLGSIVENRFVAENEHRDPRTYNFSGVTQLSISGKRSGFSGKQSVTGVTNGNWQFVAAVSYVTELTLANPSFYFTYMESVEVDDGVFYHYEQRLTQKKAATSFEIQVSHDTISASFMDYQAVTFTPVDNTFKVTLISPTDIKTTGILALEEYGHPASGFALIADIANYAGAKLILTKPDGVMKKRL